jgi:two-component system KDP operon response regulator KdpE
MTAASILVVDDEPQIRRVLRATLASQGYSITEAKSGEEALESLRRQRPDLILLDINMPGMDGVETCREVRRSSQVPIIMLTVRNAEKDKVRALDAGADDYVVKPFGIEELVARIRAALRRTAPSDSALSFSSKELSMDFEKRLVTSRGSAVHLTPKEFDLLRILVAHQGKPVSHRRLLQAVWGPDYGQETEYLRVTVNQLRKKLEPHPSTPKYILTEPWFGYRFQPPQESPPKTRTET